MNRALLHHQEGKTMGKTRVLLIDDEARTRQTLAHTLKLSGYTVIAAENGEAGLALFDAEQPDIVLLDLQMPEMDGLTVLKEMQKRDPEANVILSAGHGDKEAAIAAMRAGASDFLLKPIEPMVLESALRRAEEYMTLKCKLRASQEALRQQNAHLEAIVKANTEELRASEARYRRLAENSPDMIYRMALPDGTYEYVNSAATRLTGYPPDTWYETPFLIRDILPPDWQSYFEKEWERLLEGNAPSTYEYQIIHRNGSVRWINQRNVLLTGEDGQPIALEGILTDITARKRAQEALRESEEKYRTLFNQSISGIYLHDFEGRILDVNEMACAQLGYSKEELLKLTLFDIHSHEEDTINLPKEEILQLWRLWEPGDRFTIEAEHRHKDGTVIPVEVSTGVIRYGDKEYILAIVQDITERKQAEEALREREALLNAVGQMAKVGGWELDAETLNLTWTDQTYRIHEVPLDHQPSYEEAINFYPPGDRARLEDAIQRALDDGEPYDMEVRFITATGKPLWTRTICSPHVIEGKTVKLTGVFQDITARKQAEEEIESERAFLSAVLDTIEESVVICDKEGRIVRFNEAARQLHGLPEQPIPPDQWGAYYDLYQADGVTALPTEEIPLFRALQGEHVQDAEIVVNPRHSAPRSLVCNGQALTDAEGEITGAVVTMHDITERKQMEEKVKDYAAELERSNQDLEQFGYIVSHDLQAPLRTVKSYLGLLQQRYASELDDKAGEYIAFAVDGAQQMTQLIRALLSYARIDSRGQAPEPTTAEEVLEEILHALQLRIEEVGAEVTYDPLPTVLADPTQLGQLFQNLIENALKFRDEEAPHVHIEAALNPDPPQKGEDKMWRFSVRDNGIGIAPQHQDRIFQVFQRLHTREEYEGTGIGLAICKKIVERHGGCIWVGSEEGKGATFYFTLPGA
jgi:PAS domain S-box-containing protein